MKRIQSVLCALVLALSLSSTVLAGNIHGVSSPTDGNIHGTSASGILISGLFGDISGGIVSIFGVIIGS